MFDKDIIAIYCNCLRTNNSSFLYWEIFRGDFYIVAKIYVPMESVDEYKAADGWKDYAYKIVGYDFDE